MELIAIRIFRVLHVNLDLVIHLRVNILATSTSDDANNAERDRCQSGDSEKLLDHT